ncbi:MAG: pyridoxal-phosphate dependent enzyme [Alphaproteobacteria bacterium]|nr:pyridoxal-phosphate dependent enzyme [Alphaproteobacteria bacterium]
MHTPDPDRLRYAADLDAIRAAAARIAPHAHRTPVLTSRTLDRMAGRSLFFKCEPFQIGGAFKFRGALNAVLCLDDETAARGVVTHSSGNYAQALTIAAGIRGIPAWVVMPDNAPRVKVAAVQGYGGTVVPCPPALRQQTADRVRAETGATYLPSYDHPDVIAGQGTCGLELFEQVPDLDAVVVPTGGGGLLSGVTLAFHHLSPGTRVYGAEPRGADDAARSRVAGRIIPQTAPDTIADGLRTSLGQHTWPVVRDLVADILTVEDDEIVAAMRLLMERLKLVVEPSGAIGLAVALSPAFRALPDAERVGIVLSGGNVDLAALPF